MSTTTKYSGEMDDETQIVNTKHVRGNNNKNNQVKLSTRVSHPSRAYETKFAWPKREQVAQALFQVECLA